MHGISIYHCLSRMLQRALCFQFFIYKAIVLANFITFQRRIFIRPQYVNLRMYALHRGGQVRRSIYSRGAGAALQIVAAL